MSNKQNKFLPKPTLDEGEASDLLGAQLLESINATTKSQLQNDNKIDIDSVFCSFPNYFLTDDFREDKSKKTRNGRNNTNGYPLKSDNGVIGFLGSQIFGQSTLKSSPKYDKINQNSTKNRKKGKQSSENVIGYNRNRSSELCYNGDKFKPKESQWDRENSFKLPRERIQKDKSSERFKDKDRQTGGHKGNENRLNHYPNNKREQREKNGQYFQEKKQNFSNFKKMEFKNTEKPPPVEDHLIKQKNIDFNKGFSMLAVDSDGSYDDEDFDSEQSKNPPKKQTKSATKNHKKQNGKKSETSPPKPNKKKANLQLWSFSESAEKENIRRFWGCLSSQGRAKLTSVSKSHIVSVLAKHFSVSCVCGKCYKRETRVLEKLSELFDQFYQDLELAGEDNPYGLVTINKKDKTLRIRVGSQKIDEQFLNTANPCYLEQFDHFLCDKTLRQKRSDSLRNADFHEETNSIFEETNFDDKSLQNDDTLFPADDIQKDDFKNPSETRQKTDDHKKEKFLNLPTAIPPCSEICDLNDGHELDLLRQVSDEIGLPTPEEVPQEFLHNLLNTSVESVLEIGRTKAKNDPGNPSSFVKEALLVLLRRYAPQDVSTETIVPRVEKLLHFALGAFSLRETIKQRQNIGQKTLEVLHSNINKQEKSHNLRSECTARRQLRSLERQQAQLAEQQRLVSQYFREQSAMQRDLFTKLTYLFDEDVFTPPLDVLSPQHKAGLFRDFRNFSAIDSTLFDGLLRERYPFLSPATASDSLQMDVDSLEISDYGSDEEDFDEDFDVLSNEALSERYEECCKMFQCFAVRLFHQRVLRSYLESVAERKQEALLEEEDEERKLAEWRKKKRKERRKQYRLRVRAKRGSSNK